LRGKNYLRFVVSGVLGVVATTNTLVVLSHYMPVITTKLISTLAGFAVNFAMSHFHCLPSAREAGEKQASPHQFSADLT
jgi:putative flippase GtrA